MSPATRVLVAHLVEDVWNEGRYGELKSILAPNFTFRDLTTGQNLAGADGLKKWISELRTAFPDMQMVTEETISEGESIAHRWKIRGTHKGTYMGVRGTNKPVTFNGFSICHFRNGRIADMDVTFDRLRILEQIGAPQAMQAQA